ncbi:MAG: hypothetical protein D6798_01035, partial [Deltaproteobacteria bacterium]
MAAKLSVGAALEAELALEGELAVEEEEAAAGEYRAALAESGTACFTSTAELQTPSGTLPIADVPKAALIVTTPTDPPADS